MPVLPSAISWVAARTSERILRYRNVLKLRFQILRTVLPNPDLSAGIDLFKTARDNSDESSFTSKRLGVGVRFRRNQ